MVKKKKKKLTFLCAVIHILQHESLPDLPILLCAYLEFMRSKEQQQQDPAQNKAAKNDRTLIKLETE